MYTGYGGASAPGSQACQQGWTRPEAVAQTLHGTFHSGSGWELLRIWGEQRAVQPGAEERDAALP